MRNTVFLIPAIALIRIALHLCACDATQPKFEGALSALNASESNDRLFRILDPFIGQVLSEWIEFGARI